MSTPMNSTSSLCDVRDPRPTSTPRVTRWRRLTRLLPIGFAVALTLTFGTADAWARTNATNPTPPAAEAPASRETQPTSRELRESLPFAVSDADFDYAEREAKAAGLETFEGGDVVIIGSTGLIILLLIILLIVLL
jgi:hypothetical protein